MQEPAELNPQAILDEITRLTIEDRIIVEEKPISEGTNNRVHKAVIKGPIQVTQNGSTQILLSLEVVKISPKPTPEGKQESSPQATDIELLKQMEIDSPFLSLPLVRTKDAKFALRAKSDLRVFLQSYFENKTLPPETAKSIVGQLVLGLEALHSKKIIHGDFKADNILVFADGTVKITDFEATELILNPDGSLPKNSQSTGSLLYLPPEHFVETTSRITGEPKKLLSPFFREKNAFKADIFALGKTIKEICDALPPHGDTKTQLMELATSLMDLNPINRPNISDIKQNACFGLTKPDRTNFFGELQEKHTIQIQIGPHPIDPHVELNDAVNAIPEYFQDQYRAFRSLVRQNKPLATYLQQTSVPPPRIKTLLGVYLADLNKFLQKHATLLADTDPYSGAQQKMFAWAREQQTICSRLLATPQSSAKKFNWWEISSWNVATGGLFITLIISSVVWAFTFPIEIGWLAGVSALIAAATPMAMMWLSYAFIQSEKIRFFVAALAITIVMAALTIPPLFPTLTLITVGVGPLTIGILASAVFLVAFPFMLFIDRQVKDKWAIHVAAGVSALILASAGVILFLPEMVSGLIATPSVVAASFLVTPNLATAVIGAAGSTLISPISIAILGVMAGVILLGGVIAVYRYRQAQSLDKTSENFQPQAQPSEMPENSQPQPLTIYQHFENLMQNLDKIGSETKLESVRFFTEGDSTPEFEAALCEYFNPTDDQKTNPPVASIDIAQLKECATKLIEYCTKKGIDCLSTSGNGGRIAKIAMRVYLACAQREGFDTKMFQIYNAGVVPKDTSPNFTRMCNLNKTLLDNVVATQTAAQNGQDDKTWGDIFLDALIQRERGDLFARCYTTEPNTVDIVKQRLKERTINRGVLEYVITSNKSNIAFSPSNKTSKAASAWQYNSMGANPVEPPLTLRELKEIDEQFKIFLQQEEARERKQGEQKQDKTMSVVTKDPLDTNVDMEHFRTKIAQYFRSITNLDELRGYAIRLLNICTSDGVPCLRQDPHSEIEFLAQEAYIAYFDKIHVTEQLENAYDGMIKLSNTVGRSAFLKTIPRIDSGLMTALYENTKKDPTSGNDSLVETLERNCVNALLVRLVVEPFIKKMLRKWRLVQRMESWHKLGSKIYVKC